MLFPQGAASLQDAAAKDVDIQVFGKNQHLKKAKISVAHFAWQGQAHACLSLRVALIEDLELRLAKEEMLEFKQASENKSRFLAYMSHEIRTPLNGVLGMIDLLASSALNAEQSAYLSSLRKSSKTLRALIDDVLDFSKIEAGQVEPERVPFDMVETVNAVVQALNPVAMTKGVALQFEQGLEHPCYFGDPHRLSQVLNNLVSNALKFTAQGGVKITVSARMLFSDQDLCRLTMLVTDTGTGIAPEQRAQHFNAFRQGSASVSRQHCGTGLGLYISKQLVELMGGQISLTSEPGKGSTFEFWVDLQPSYSSTQTTDTLPLRPSWNHWQAHAFDGRPDGHTAHSPAPAAGLQCAPALPGGPSGHRYQWPRIQRRRGPLPSGRHDRQPDQAAVAGGDAEKTDNGHRIEQVRPWRIVKWPPPAQSHEISSAFVFSNLTPLSSNAANAFIEQ